ncbi:hypothetical protein N7467_011243 [Penicillium canescens]|nr:hypothetical protein N7467_011243 [Penicillium canescens]
MASHPSILLDPKSYKKQVQNNGNHPASSTSSLSPAGDHLEMRPATMPYESLQVPPGSSTSSPIPASLFSSALPSHDFSSCHPMDTSVTTGAVTLASVETHAPTALDSSSYQMDTTMITGEPPVASVETHDPTALDPLGPITHSSHGYSFYPGVTDPMSVESTLTLGSLREPTGRRKKNDMSPAHPMAPPGTATTSFRGPSPMASPNQPTSRVSSPAPKPESNLTVQFTTTLDEANESDSKRSYHEMSDEEDVRRPNLIEDVYGVEHRKNPPTKKVKTDDTDEKPSMANIPITISGDTGLGKFMKEGEGNQTATPTASAVVDLTADATNASNDDDDEVQCTGSADLSTQEVCFGRIENAFINAHHVPQPPPNPVFNDSASHWTSIKLDLRRQPTGNFQIDAIDPYGNNFGMVDAKTAIALCPLLDSTAWPVGFTARLDTRKKVPGEVIGGPVSGIYRASINLYGQRQHATGIGKFLGQKNVWLGTPTVLGQGSILFNPHANVRRQMNAAAVAGNNVTGRSTVRYEVRTAEEVNDAVMKMFDQLITVDIPTMEPSSHILTPLLPHQKQALWFMTEKEKPRKFGPNEEDNNSLWRMVRTPGGKIQYREIITGLVLDSKPEESLGGLLADMMGLGKTLSILSLITASLESSLEWKRLAPHPSLVRAIPGIRNTRTTLLVVPLSAVSNWTTQINEHLAPDSIKCHTFHGPNRITDLDELAKYDVLITTYSTVLSEMNGRGARRGDSPLRKMNMFRIVLDEAHTIREQNARQTKAILDLNAERKWSVTGTPIQNRLEDLLSVTKFLRIYPYNERSSFVQHILSPFKTGDPTVLASLRVMVDSFTLRRVKDRINLPPRNDNMVILDFTEQEKQLHEFFRNESNVMMRVIAGESKNKMGGRMYHHVLKAMMILRQVSAHGKELLDIEDRERIKGLSVHDAIDLEEGEPAETPAALDKKAYGMFSMRQDMAEDLCATETCNKPLEPILAANGEVDRDAPMAIYLPCGCVFCPNCFSGWKEVFDSNSETPMECPGCKGWTAMAYSVITPTGLDEYQAQQDQERRDRQNGKVGKVFGEYEGPHTKTTALLNYLKGSVEDSKKLEGEPPIKSVVFSGWTSHLDLIEIALRNNGLNGFVRLDGTMTLAARMKALELFAKDDSITILLATIGAGGVGLNLTSASRVFIMEPQYNPAAVAQAVDRVHRLGQTRPVETYQFVMKGSIEEKIQELAKKKQQLADMSMNRGKLDKREVQEARMREYRSLFK